MDPDKALEELLKLCREQHHENRTLAERFPNGPSHAARELDLRFDRVAELVTVLDQWIRGGGFIPTAWTNRKGKFEPRSCPSCNVGYVIHQCDTEWCSRDCGWTCGK